MRARLATLGLLVVAGLLDLPAVYLFLREEGTHPFLVLFTGLLGMGLAWSGGCILEGRRRVVAALVTLLGVLQPLLLLLPGDAGAAARGAWPWLAASAGFSLASFAVFPRR